jgi:hypothetical protein
MPFYPGDVVIRRKRGISICSLAVVLDAGVLPVAGQSMDFLEAWHYATRLVAGTDGQIYELGDDDHPYSH